MSRGLHPRECEALNLLDAGEPIAVVAHLCRLSIEDCRALARANVSRVGGYDDVQAALSGRQMFDDEMASGAWWIQ